MRFFSYFELKEASHELSSSTEDAKHAVVLLKQDPDFWHKLANLANSDPIGLSSLLGVKSDQVGDWYSRIHAADKVAQNIKQETKQKKISKVG